MLDQCVPEFTLPATGGKAFSLSHARGRILVIYFYPKDSTPGCTTEAQQFRTLYPEFLAAGSFVIGASRDSLRTHENFKAKLGLPFELLADTEAALCTQFSVLKEKKLYGKPVRGIERSTFVIDRNGVVRGAWRGIKAEGHAQEILDFVKTL